MRIENRAQLTSVGDKKVRSDLLDVLEAAVESVDPYVCVREALRVKGDILSVSGEGMDLGQFKRIFVVGAGKAAEKMAKAVDDEIGDRVSAGFINSLREGRIGNITIHKATHPRPGIEGMRGAMEIKRICEGAGEDDMIICLISGGGSAMMPCPAEGIELEEKGRMAETLMLAGATIEELNAVRRHLSCLKGGNLARAAYPATLLSLIISDVVGDSLESIASGPTAPDPTSFRDAFEVLRKYDVVEAAPISVRERLLKGGKENPKPGDKVFEKVRNLIVASNSRALAAAKGKGEELGYRTLVLTASLTGEARDVGQVFGALGNEIVDTSPQGAQPTIVIAGGETTVTVRGKGRGGRNGEVVLGGLLRMKEGVTLLSFGTDGIDGSSDAGGALADCGMRRKDLMEYLEKNDSHTYLQREGGLIRTGPTGTNVGDIILLAVSRKA